MTNAEWFHSLQPEPAHQTKYEPDNVIHLPKIDRVLPCGWKASEMKDFCRRYCQLRSEDEVIGG